MMPIELAATDAGIDLDRSEARRDVGGWIYLTGCNPWSMLDHAEARLGYRPCPVCKGHPLGRKVYCLACDRSGLDDRVTFPGLAPDERRDPDWEGGEWREVGRQAVA